MSPKYTAQERLKLIERVILGGEKAAEVCRKAGISRVLFYSWLKKYREAGQQIEALVPGKKKISISPRKVTPQKEKQILAIVKEHPQWSTKKISAALPKEPSGKPIVGNHGVQNVLQRLNLSTREERTAYIKAVSRPKEEVLTGVQLTPEQKLEMLEKVVIGKEKVSKVCQEYGISRTLFYRLKRRYEEAALEEKLRAVAPAVRHIERYWRQTPERYERAVLDLVGKHPEYSVRKLVAHLPEVAGVPIVGHHGVQNILHRYNLSLYEQRQAFASAQVTPITRFVGAFEQAFARLFVFPVETRAAVVRFLGIAAASTFATVVVLGSLGYFATVFKGVAPIYRPGLAFASIALSVGSIFFLYSMKYYFTLAIVLSFSRQPGEPAVLGLNGEFKKNGNGGWLSRIFGLRPNGPIGPEGLGKGKERRVVGLEPNLESVKLEKHPFVSVHLPFYNEKKVAERILSACTSFDYPNYEVIVVDDSTDETVEILKGWQNHPKVKIVHRQTREGFKGGALREALKHTDPKAEFVVVFDADFIPYPDTLELFLKYFKTYNQDSEDFSKSNIACVQGYQWHVLNKSENWITRGIRSEYAGSYVIERSGTEVLGALKQIAGSVYMVRADLLKKFGWGTSITEDFELTLRLYEQGYKVVYTPYVQGPAECVSTIKRLIRQRMRWAEGHSHNVRKMFLRLLGSPRMTLTEKMEFLYLSPYYLQAFFFLVGTFSWLMAETVFRARLPFWTSLWGWSLVLTNFFSLPLMNAVGLFLEEGENKDYLGILSFIALSYLLVPFQAYASVKGFLEREEGPWFRTPKTGLITDIFTRGKFYRWISGIIPGRRPAVVPAPGGVLGNKPAWATNPYLALATANNRFEDFQIKRKRLPWVARAALAILLIFTTTFFQLSQNIKVVQATGMVSPLKLSQGQVGDGTWPAWGNYMTNNSNGYGTGTLFRFNRRNANSSGNNYTWYTNLLPVSDGGDAASVPAGQYFVQLAKSGYSAAGNYINFGLQLLLTNNNGTTRTQILWGIQQINTSDLNNTIFQYYVGNKSAANTITYAARNRFALRVLYINANTTSATVNWLINNSTVPARLFLPGNLIIPEIPLPMVMAMMLAIMPVLPTLVSGRLRKPGQNIFEEFFLAWKDLMRQLTGKGEEALDELPV